MQKILIYKNILGLDLSDIWQGAKEARGKVSASHNWPRGLGFHMDVQLRSLLRQVVRQPLY